MSDEWVSVGGGDFFKWDEVGKTLIGTWRGTVDGAQYPTGLMELEDGSKIRFGLKTALANRLNDVDEGTKVKIVYTGKAKSKAGNQFMTFDVFEAKGTAPF